jgi:hypothetical protein
LLLGVSLQEIKVARTRQDIRDEAALHAGCSDSDNGLLSTVPHPPSFEQGKTTKENPGGE